MNLNEDEHIEFKKAEFNFDTRKLLDYCAAIANERGGRLILGITDKKPRKIIGTKAFQNKIEKTKEWLLQKIPLRIEIEELSSPEGRIIIFHVPSRPIGLPIHINGRYLMRSGGSLIAMSPDMLKKIFDESGPDFSTEICKKASMDDLEFSAVEDFRQRWMKKSGNESNESSGPPQQRVEFRRGFFTFYDELWKLIDLRNTNQHYQEGLFIWDIKTFNESAIREMILNAFCHRDYRMEGSVFIRQYPDRIEVVNPGGLPPGITFDNILWEQAPRNKRLAESFSRCGLVERSGQGMNRIYESCIKESKAEPDFTHSDDNHFWISLHGTVRHPEFLRVLEKIGDETLQTFSTDDLIVIQTIFENKKVSPRFAKSVEKLMEEGLLEKATGRKGKEWILSRRIYSAVGKSGTYTRKKGLDRETNKELLFKHIHNSEPIGAKMEELLQVLPTLDRHAIRSLLDSLRKEERIYVVGYTNAARWHIDKGKYIQNDN